MIDDSQAQACDWPYESDAEKELAALRAELAAVKADWNNHAVNGLGEIERMRAELAAVAKGWTE